MGITATIALSMGAAWACGINLYATVFMLGFMGLNGYVELPAELQYLQDPLVLTVAGIMYCIEFFADKTPGVDSGWDVIHSFIRIPAGAVLAMQGIATIAPEAQLAALLIGGSLAACSHTTKMGSRFLINTSPEPVTNWTASIGEDLLVIGGLWTALNYPVVFLVLLAAIVVLMIWMLPKIWRGMKRLGSSIAEWFRGRRSGRRAEPQAKVEMLDSPHNG
jgi:hypothetical protein